MQPTPSNIRIPELDGLRAIAILLVMVNHFTPWAFRGDQPFDAVINRIAAYGGGGVDLFFVLSGFLITGILLDTKGRPDYFQRFFLRRSLRVFPIYYAFLIPVCLGLGSLFLNIGRPWFLFYLRNFRGADPASDAILGHLWSLAVEEQFYAIWPLVIFFCSRRTLGRLCLCLLVLAPLVRGWMHFHHFAAYLIMRVTPARMDTLVIGALVALAYRSKLKITPYAKGGILAGLAGLLLLTPDIQAPLTQLLRPTISAVFFASCLALAVTCSAPLLRLPALARIAKYSYAIYLFHLPAGLWTYSLCRALGLPGRTLALPLAALGVYGCAAASWKWLEAPALRLADSLTKDGAMAMQRISSKGVCPKSLEKREP